MVAWTNPTTRSTGNTITASIWNADVVDNLDWLGGEATGGKPSCRVYNSSNFSVAHDVQTAITFNSERWDNGAMHSTSVNTSRITIPSGGGGKYLIGGHVSYDSNATGGRSTLIVVNGSTIVAGHSDNALTALPLNHSISTMYPLSAGDYVELHVYQTSGGNLDIVAGGNYTPEFWAMWMAV